ncbi:L-lactate dehydrogenase (quinone) large subunit LdhH [Geoalkalibacter halelectricus]|uniref:LUD domain-containing protein n=1 Tax=Geoalkalibacter halelectricus TaxID=2847045 RepID=A0ABY5ZLR6_9BACT|nr:LUD domain-containing protein [Geoalkalibacter halelectricus]MDO3378601.1 LUD domain-containing protein [Geoalkalibacter halelectricus]UWZ80086.1 LUD domain-containing protein [Geoalkalibacter halelectricus]
MNKRRTQEYKQRIDQALATPKLQDALHKFGDAYLVSRANAFAGLDFEALRREIAAMKDEVRERREEFLARFTDQARAKGAIVYVAKSAQDANDYIAQLAQKRGVRTVAKSKSMASEEIHLNDALEKVGAKAVETDLGEWIIQLAGQRPSHMVMPAIHMFKEEVAELFGKVTGREEPAEIAHLVQVAREQLRQTYLDADMGITGANIAVAETGTLALVTNEGNARLVATLPKIHVALVGIEKLVPTLEDAARVIRVLPKNATGQPLTSYVTWITGAVPCGEADKELHIVLLDNGRSALAGSPHCRDALRCIRCGACANVCPVYQTVGGHVFGHIYIGAIGIILTAFFHGLDKAAEIVRACIGCRACVAICPSHIDLEGIILHLRSVIGDEEGIGAGKSLVFKKVMRNRKLFHGLIRAASLLQKPVSKGERTIRHLPAHFSSFTEWRTLPTIAEKPLRDQFAHIVQKVDKPRYRVAFFGGCGNDFIYPEMGLDLVKVLNHLGVEVFYPEEQNCCGIPALYSGDRETAVELAEQNVAAMLAENPDFVVTTCPTCTLALRRDFVEHLKDNPAWAQKAEALAEKTLDVSAFIHNVLGDTSALAAAADGEKLTYHDSCHLRRGGGVWQEPRALLKSAGFELHEMAHADRCCGFGGSYSFTSHPPISREITKDKVRDIEQSGAAVVAMDCPGCLIMLRGALEKRALPVRAAHTIELLAESLSPKVP